jgi:dolichol-phosphate mannosyltransferase
MATKLPMPVNDRPRLKDVSKYTNLGRAMVGICDLVGVSWLRRRTQLPPIAEDRSGARQLSGEG